MIAVPAFALQLRQNKDTLNPALETRGDCVVGDVEMCGSDVLARPLAILVAEDNQTNLMILNAFLSNMGHASTSAQDGEEALRLWRTGKYDLILMDIRMPRLDGVAATAAIRRQEAENGVERTPIIGISAHDDADVIDGCLTHGMDGYVSKPCGMAALARALEPYSPRS